MRHTGKNCLPGTHPSMVLEIYIRDKLLNFDGPVADNKDWENNGKTHYFTPLRSHFCQFIG